MTPLTRICSRLFPIGLVALLGSASPALADEVPGHSAVLGVIDKITARTNEITIPVGGIMEVGRLEVRVRSCIKRIPPDEPEDAAFLDISEHQPEGPDLEVFRGWMFASSPALSAMDHAVYDVWVLDCPILDDGTTTATPAAE